MGLKEPLSFMEKVPYEIIAYTDDSKIWCIYDL